MKYQGVDLETVYNWRVRQIVVFVLLVATLVALSRAHVAKGTRARFPHR
jgi:hypothetical protein